MTILLAGATSLIILAATIQIALPRVVSRRIEAHLTAAGGTADVRIEAMPALRLLSHRGDRLVVRGSGMTVGLNPPAGEDPGLKALDGFAEVDIELVGLRAGPFEVDGFVLVRHDGGSYAMAAAGAVSALGSRVLPVALEAELRSEPGGLSVGAGGGRIAGYPAGPLAAAVAVAVARRLELAP